MTAAKQRITATEVRALLLRIGRLMRAFREKNERERRGRLGQLFRDHGWARPRPEADESD